MSAYSKGKRVYRKARRTGNKVGGLLMAVGVAMALEGHLVGGAGSLSTAMAFLGDASAVIGLGMMLKQATR